MTERTLVEIPVCPVCGANIHPEREGVRFTPLLAVIFDKIKKGGDDGVSKGALLGYLEEVTGKTQSEKALSMSVHRINEEFKIANKKIRIKHYRESGVSSIQYKKGQRIWIYYYYLCNGSGSPF